MRPRTATGADAQAAPGALGGGRSGAIRAGAGGRIDWPATLFKGRPRNRQDLLQRPRSARPTELWLVIVDASASTRRHGALSKAKGLLAEVFEQARRQRARLAVLHATGRKAQWMWQGQQATQALQQWLTELGAGGGTPLLDALRHAAAWQARRQRLHPAESQRLLIITDGRLRDWPALAPSGCPALLVDIESAPIRLGRARQLADELGAHYRHIDTLPVVHGSPEHAGVEAP
ncbi:vWA domain-containing protein [Pseudomonas paeninsulae]|uniref:vWA domain-containing protein n=1 Tax=Pseudomonas paeninsulae TaxID=3110772 RepID=UPI002D76E8E2|nr:VWA domain-containing protein [Pseudomonas sp. IT1137]